MKKLLLVLLVLLVLGLALPSTTSAVRPSGTPVLVPDGAADSAADGGGPRPKSWLFNDIFFVRAHICRALNVTICGPDPLVNSGASYNGVIRIWVPFSDVYTVHIFVTDSEGNVMDWVSSNFNIAGDSFASFSSTFHPLPDEPERSYLFHGLAIGNGSGAITFSNRYQFRIGGPSSNSCCP